MKRFYVYFFILQLAFNFVISQNYTPQKNDFYLLIQELDNEIPLLLESYRSPGLAIALIHNGAVVWEKGYGYANKEKEIKVTPHTVFQAASISKSVTAWIVMKLVEEEKLDLDIPVISYLKKWQLPATSYNVKGVTVRRMLSHTAGISLGGFPGFRPDHPLPSIEKSLSGENSSREPVRVFKEPGTEFDYSGGGYMLLSHLIEEVTQERFEVYSQRELLDQLVMKNSCFLWDEKLRPNTATAYDKNGNPLPNFLFSSKGAASLYCSASDLAKFVAASMPGPNKELIGRDILQPSTVKQMYKPIAETTEEISLLIDSVASGYFVDPMNGITPMISHTGSNNGWRNVFAFFPKTGDGIVVLTNSNNGRNVYVEIMDIWSRWITGHETKMCKFFGRVYTISSAVSIFLFAGLLIYISLSIKDKKYQNRVLFWKNPDKSYLYKFSRAVLVIIIPGIILYTWYSILHPLLDDISPLTSEWILAGFFSWTLISFINGIYPKSNTNKFQE